MTWHRDHTGKTSMMRVGFMSCLSVGAVLSISGVVAVFAGLDGDIMITAGAGLMGSSGFAKAIQSKYEKGVKKDD